MNAPTLSPKVKRSVPTVGGALSIILTWLLDLTGVTVPDYVLVAFAIVIMSIAERMGERDDPQRD